MRCACGGEIPKKTAGKQRGRGRVVVFQGSQRVIRREKSPLPDPLKTPPFFSQWAKLQNFFETRAERKRPLARVDQGNDSKT